MHIAVARELSRSISSSTSDDELFMTNYKTDTEQTQTGERDGGKMRSVASTETER